MTVDQMKAALDAAETRGKELREKRDTMDPATATDEDVATLEQEMDDAITEVERTRANLVKRIKDDAILDADPVEIPTPKAPASARGSQAEEAPYRRDRGTFFHDLITARDNPEARDRLVANNKYVADEQQRAGMNQTATTGGEFIPPLWLTEFFAKLRAGRAVVDAVGTKPLPPLTNSINLPGITTGATAAVQTDGGAVSNTDQVTASKTAQVQTIAGRTVASYQLVELSSPGFDEVVFQDILAAYNQALDVAVINGAVANAKGLLNVTGINAITYTDASPTLPEFYPPLFQGKSSIEKNAFDSPHFVALHPSVWNSFLADLDTATRPLALSTDSARFNAAGAFEYSAQGLVGNIAGLPVISDANIPVNLGGGTNESRAIIVNRRGFDIWESTPTFKVADQTSITTLQYQLVLYGFYAVMSRQPAMISVVSGTGMIPRASF